LECFQWAAQCYRLQIYFMTSFSCIAIFQPERERKKDGTVLHAHTLSVENASFTKKFLDGQKVTRKFYNIKICILYP